MAPQNPPAFPGKRLAHWSTVTDRKGPHDPALYSVTDGGMSLRDYFAGQALAGMLGNSHCSDDGLPVVAAAYKLADAMLAEREKGSK